MAGSNLTIWDEGKTKKEISKRFSDASRDRSYLEDRWIANEISTFSTTLRGGNFFNLDGSMTSGFFQGQPGVDQSNADVVSSYVFKNFRFIHAQMSANPPSVAMRPTTSDQEDIRRADAADQIVRWSIRHYVMQEKVDQLNLNALLYGTGAIKTVWDASRGDIIGFNEEEDRVETEGDIAVTIPFVWNLYIDPDAKAIDEVKWVIERVYMDYDEACHRWPDKEDVLKRAKIVDTNNASTNPNNRGRNSYLNDSHYNCVELLEYWETGLPSNGMLGRFCITTVDGDPLEKCRPNPFRFTQAGAVAKIEAMDIPDEVKERKLERLPEKAHLPYHFLTDIDIPNKVWGRSCVEYASQLQDTLNKIDSATIDNVQAHGVARLILPENVEIQEDGLANSPWDVTRITGNERPHFMEVPNLMPEMTSSRNNLKADIDNAMGINESMLGQQSRQTSGASMQYATNQGNMIRRRLFNKYVLVVESVYKAILNLIRKHWTVERTIHVLGKEKALEAVDLKGADIDGGYDVIGEYGVTLSLDPITRREEIITLQPLFKAAGVPEHKVLEMMKLNDLQGMYDKLTIAGTRQKEIFDAMIATGTYIPPKKFRDQENMIAWALEYFMSSEYNNLTQEIQDLCERHVEERAQLAAQESAGTAAPTSNLPPQSPGPVPQETAGPVPAPAGLPEPQA